MIIGRRVARSSYRIREKGLNSGFREFPISPNLAPKRPAVQETDKPVLGHCSQTLNCPQFRGHVKRMGVKVMRWITRSQSRTTNQPAPHKIFLWGELPPFLPLFLPSFIPSLIYPSLAIVLVRLQECIAYRVATYNSNSSHTYEGE